MARRFDWADVPRTSGVGSAGKPRVVATSVAAMSRPTGVGITQALVPGTMRVQYVCRVCGCRGQSSTFCGICGRRNCMVEAPPEPMAPGAAAEAEVRKRGSLSAAIGEGRKIVRIRSGIPKLDRVLGGGYVERTGILIAGDPGAGKSTLLLQACLAFVGPVKKRVEKRRKKNGEKEYEWVETGEVRRALYCSGEEAFDQVGARAARLPSALEKGEYIEFVTTRNTPEVMGAILDVRPHITVVDSVQEIGDELISGRFGGENQVSNLIRSTMSMIREVGHGVGLFVCHVRKDGDIAGAKKAEHLVDMVCKLSIELREEEDEEDEDLAEDEKTVHDERMLEAYKNRYGSITERSVFKMTAEGLR